MSLRIKTLILKKIKNYNVRFSAILIHVRKYETKRNFEQSFFCSRYTMHGPMVRCDEQCAV